MTAPILIRLLFYNILSLRFVDIVHHHAYLHGSDHIYLWASAATLEGGQSRRYQRSVQPLYVSEKYSAIHRTNYFRCYDSLYPVTTAFSYLPNVLFAGQICLCIRLFQNLNTYSVPFLHSSGWPNQHWHVVLSRLVTTLIKDPWLSNLLIGRSILVCIWYNKISLFSWNYVRNQRYGETPRVITPSGNPKVTYF